VTVCEKTEGEIRKKESAVTFWEGAKRETYPSLQISDGQQSCGGFCGLQQERVVRAWGAWRTKKGGGFVCVWMLA